jgi:tRNA-2-methylthio-N6-dimethylallyladenosine synthase
MDNQVSEGIKAERLTRLNDQINLQMHAFHRSVVGRTLPVLIEKPGRQPGQIGGRSPYLQAVHLDGPTRLIGQIVPVEIVEARNNSLIGKIVTDAEQNPASVVESRANAAHI